MQRGPSFWNGSSKSSPRAGTTGGTLATKAGKTSANDGAVFISTGMEGEVAATKAGTAMQTKTGGVVLKADRGIATVEITKSENSEKGSEQNYKTKKVIGNKIQLMLYQIA